jgi:hypothetical protein
MSSKRCNTFQCSFRSSNLGGGEYHRIVVRHAQYWRGGDGSIGEYRGVGKNVLSRIHRELRHG